MKHLISILFFILIHSLINAQQYGKYWAFFSDKCSDKFNPYEYFDEKAIDRRLKNNIPLSDITDFPVCENYVNQLKEIADSTTHLTRWFNAIAFYGTTQQVAQIESLSFVDSVRLISSSVPNKITLCEKTDNHQPQMSQIDKMLLAQLKIMGSEYFEKNNINGKGIRIAVFDAGFPYVDKSKAFKHIVTEGNLIATYDFVKRKEFVYGFSHHGSNVLSCIGGIYDSTKIGLATAAEFLLARTENSTSEPFSEEENWLAAVEWADKNGVQIINSSLAYTKHRYFNSEMNGSLSLVSRSANLAAKKGILVVNAAGNDGDNGWKYVGTPGDADSVLTVGGINPYTNYHIGFSSFGPTSDKRMKPNVCAYGEAVVAGNNEIHTSQGTSFASPLIAGFAACIWQLHPEYNNMQVFDAVQKASNLYPYYDYAHGYGVPNASYFFEEQKPTLPTISFDETENNILVRIKDGEYEKNIKGDYIYYHIENKTGYLNGYKLIQVESKNPISIKKSQLNPGDILRVYYKGFIASYKI